MSVGTERKKFLDTIASCLEEKKESTLAHTCNPRYSERVGGKDGQSWQKFLKSPSQPIKAACESAHLSFWLQKKDK
jgi:hypothetical protein